MSLPMLVVLLVQTAVSGFSKVKTMLKLFWPLQIRNLRFDV